MVVPGEFLNIQTNSILSVTAEYSTDPSSECCYTNSFSFNAVMITNEKLVDLGFIKLKGFLLHSASPIKIRRIVFIHILKRKVQTNSYKLHIKTSCPSWVYVNF